MALLISEINGPASWDCLQLMSMVVAWDRGFLFLTNVQNENDDRTAGQWRFHVLGEHMRDRLLHLISEFYRPRASNRPLRYLVVATRGEHSDTDVFRA